MATEEKAVYTNFKGQSNYRTWRQDMEVMFGAENTLKIILREKLYLPKPTTPADLMKQAFIEQVLQPAAQAAQAAQEAPATSAALASVAMPQINLQDWKLVNECFENYKKE